VTAFPLVGYRLWAVNDACGDITGITDDAPWPVDGPMVAHKSPADTDPEYAPIQPGIHGYYRFHHGRDFRLDDSFMLWYRIERIKRRLTGTPGGHWVAGAFIGWGSQVVLHEFGFRCERALPLALFYRPGQGDMARSKVHGGDPFAPPRGIVDIADSYGIHLFDSVADIVAYAEEWGAGPSRWGMAL
jgi:hypothetical protein